MVKRVVDTNFWTDMQVMDHYSIEDKYFMLYLLTNTKSTQVGIYSLPKKVMAFETGLTNEVIDGLLNRFTSMYEEIVYSAKTQEVTILNSLNFSILRGGKPVQDLLERELSKVRDGELIQATYDAMLTFWQTSKRSFDQTIQELFEEELTRRGFFQKESQKENHNDSQIYNANHRQNHNDYQNQDSWDESASLNRDTTRKDDEKALIHRYAEYLKRLKPDLTKELTEANVLDIFYEELIGEITPHIRVMLDQWANDFPKSFILEALNRSIEANYPIVYAGEILKNWAKHAATCFKDIIQLDQEHSKNSA